VPRSRQISDGEIPRYRLTLSDVFWALAMVAWTALGIVVMLHDVEEYRWQQRAIADFVARMPKMIGEAPYDPAVGRRLIAEAAGCIITLIGVVLAIRRRRRRHGVEVSVKWLAEPQLRIESTKAAAARAAPAPPAQSRAAAMLASKSGALAADRLSVVLWSDHVARLEKEHA
jgi:hypothetical protein